MFAAEILIEGGKLFGNEQMFMNIVRIPKLPGRLKLHSVDG